MPIGSLNVIGSGIQAIRQITLEGRMAIEKADKVLYIVADPASEEWIKKLNSSSESLYGFYMDGKPRRLAYMKMVERILGFVRKGLDVTAVFYGHPGIFSYPGHEAVRQARLEGFYAQMLPGISAADCLFCDIGIDPGLVGCQYFEATDFLVHRRKFDTSSYLILWQIGIIGDSTYPLTHIRMKDYNLDGLSVLSDTLQKHYGADHGTIVYEAAQYSVCDPIIQRVSLNKITELNFNPIATLFVPPKQPSKIDKTMLKRLHINPSLIPRK